jgi:hypothetical protein
MSRAVLWGALALNLIVVAISANEAKADQQSCAQFRDSIIKMETDSVRPPGWFALDRHLRALYTQDCLLHPTRQAPAQYWYTIDGKPTGVLAFDPVVYDRDAFEKKYPNGMPDRPPGAAYATTPEINERCLKSGTEPSVCVMVENLREACANPVDTQERNQCKAILGKDQTPSMPPPGEELPPMRVALDGGPYTLSPNCDAVLGRVSGDPLLEGADAEERARWLGMMRSECRDFLDALKRRTGIDPDKDPGGFWPAVGNLAFNGFAPPGTPSQTPASIYADPGWQRMCKDAATHQNTCLQRQTNMQSLAAPLIKNTVGPGSPGADNPPEPPVTPRNAGGYGTNQADAFGQCAALYGQVLNMCKANEMTALRTAARMPPPAPPKPAPPKPAPPPQQAAAQPKPSGGDSRPPPQQAASAPSQCQQLAAKYVAAAQANDGPGAIAGYNALKAAGGCGVLDKVPPLAAAAPTAGGDPRFISRGARPGIDSTVGACNASPAECQEAMRQLEAGTSPAAKAALMANAISVGLQLGAAMANGLAAAAPPGGSGGGGGGQPTVRGNNTDMRSLAPAPIHNGRGQGSGTAPPQYNNQSTITGTAR